ncbi:hypothetical protein J3R30DRAFT_3850176 [Lentinula aciculospora]|uniref:Uncharacterized protein n=1 Tax=Lentinula aciculospora TaxID=153920 RepID=A0A9W9DET4_9AGAR|nr:hypothetical protein J3R30DRAFT_3850176 [Lentinula aciculospora]
MNSGNLPKIYKIPLETRFYGIDAEDIEFFQKETKAQDKEELRKHIIAVQAKAYSIYRYPCIRMCEFMRLKMARLPAYPHLLKLSRDRTRALFPDLTFGNDARKAIQADCPIQNDITSDLHKDFWDLGHKMSKSAPESFPVPFIQGDVFDQDILEKQIASALAGLLSPEPGPMILGVHGSRAEKGFWHPTESERHMLCHSPKSWKDLWEGLFGQGDVEVKAQSRKEIGGDDLFGTYPGNKDLYHIMEWSILRI